MMDPTTYRQYRKMKNKYRSLQHQAIFTAGVAAATVIEGPVSHWPFVALPLAVVVWHGRRVARALARLLESQRVRQ